MNNWCRRIQSGLSVAIEVEGYQAMQAETVRWDEKKGGKYYYKKNIGARVSAPFAVSTSLNALFFSITFLARQATHRFLHFEKSERMHYTSDVSYVKNTVTVCNTLGI